MTSESARPELLNLNQTPQELAGLYGEQDYYWYLRSMPFREAFFKPIAQIVNELGQPCLDVGCGEACLADYVTVPYAGFDGSKTAIRRALNRIQYLHQLQTSIHCTVGRMEDPPFAGEFGTLVFGGIMEVLIKPESRVPLIEMYRKRYNAVHAVIYDLERLDTSAIERAYGQPLREFYAKAEGVETLEVKLSRKILLYRVAV